MENILNYIKNTLKDNFDIRYREIYTDNQKITIIFADSLCDGKFISEYIISPIEQTKEKMDIEYIKNRVLNANNVDYIKNNEDLIMHIVSGDVVILNDQEETVIYCEAKGFPKRSINIPITQAVIKGPREGFNEAVMDNVSLIRRKIKNPNLKLENFVVGKKSNTSVVMCYIKDSAPQKLVEDIRQELMSLDYEFILDTNYIEGKLTKNKSFFDTIGNSEKPDEVASKLLEGRIAVIVDGTPFVLILPFLFLENFHMSDDYYINKYFSNCLRIIRWVAFFTATLLPSLYVAIVTHHFSLIPSVFVFRLAVSRAGVPFPTVIEVLMMIVFFQLIKEAGVRLPQPIGQAMSIVGALILGDAAVGAGLASQITILIVALSTISYFLIPRIYGAVSIWSVFLVITSAFLGLPGFYIGFFMLVSHLASLESYGYPFLEPIGTLKTIKYKDSIIRGNLKEISKDILKVKSKR